MKGDWVNWLVGCLEEQLVGTSKKCVRYKVPCRYRCIGERVTQLARDCDGKCECVCLVQASFSLLL